VAKFLIVAWDAAGGLMPALGLARRLGERGHDVRLLASPSIHRRWGQHSWRFRAFQETPDYDITAPKDMSTEVPVLSRNLWFNPAVGRDLQAELDQERADVVVVDCMLWAGLSAAVGSGMPIAAVFHQPYSGFIAREGMFVQPLNLARAAMGIEPVESLGDLYGQCDLCIVTVPRELEAEHVAFPPAIRWVGPVLESPGLATDVSPLPDLRGERFVLISFGTGYQAQLSVLQRLVDAAGEIPRRFLVTTGPAVAPSAVKLPANVTAVSYIPHDLLLLEAELVITHAGLGTVMAALRHGLPLLCVPLGRDQFRNANWVQSKGVGLTLPADADVSMIGGAIEGLLAPDAAERKAAKGMARVFERYGGADDAADACENLVPALSTARHR
jgi:UDP:flavonoid glycosyltransferase YjiC (YdhE family)